MQQKFKTSYHELIDNISPPVHDFEGIRSRNPTSIAIRYNSPKTNRILVRLSYRAPGNSGVGVLRYLVCCAREVAKTQHDPTTSPFGACCLFHLVQWRPDCDGNRTIADTLPREAQVGRDT